jgi:hypothetical protein
VSTILNQVNCDKAPNCDHLNRYDCYSVTNTCGTCKIGFIGDVGNSNNQCIDLLRITTNNRNLSIISNNDNNDKQSDCYVDNDCSVFEKCDIKSKKCYLPSKTCYNDCSNHGICIYININTNLNVKECKINDISCRTKCICDDNTDFIGPDCSESRQEYIQQQALRNDMITRLLTTVSSSSSNNIICSNNNNNNNNVDRLSNTLSLLIGNSNNIYEVPFKMARNITQVTESIMTCVTKQSNNNTENKEVTYQSMTGILNSINTIMQVSQINTNNNDNNTTTTNNNNNIAQNSQVLELFSDLISSQIQIKLNECNFSRET